VQGREGDAAGFETGHPRRREGSARRLEPSLPRSTRAARQPRRSTWSMRAPPAFRRSSIARAVRQGLTGPADGLLARVSIEIDPTTKRVESRSRANANVLLGLGLKARPMPRLEVQCPAPDSLRPCCSALVQVVGSSWPRRDVRCRLAITVVLNMPINLAVFRWDEEHGESRELTTTAQTLGPDPLRWAPARRCRLRPRRSRSRLALTGGLWRLSPRPARIPCSRQLFRLNVPHPTG